MDGIEVIEFDLPYSNHAGLLERALVFLRYSWQSLQLALRSDADLVFATTTPLTAGIPGIVARWLRGTPFVFEVRDLWPELPRAMGVVRNPLVLAALSALEWLSLPLRRCLYRPGAGDLRGHCGAWDCEQPHHQHPQRLRPGVVSPSAAGKPSSPS